MHKDLQQRLGYHFKDAALLEAALTHSSHSVDNYERLEFIGDRVLGLAVADMLWGKFPEAHEGELSRRFTALVRESCLVQVAGFWNVSGAIRYGAGELERPSILADVVEAILGAIWLDGGLEAVKDIVSRDWADLSDVKDEKDPKSRLQEWLQGKGFDLPLYEVLEERGPAHDKHFTVKVITAKGESLGEGRSKQVASANAAQAMMMILESEGN
jgi:ribonuclease III